MPLGLVSAILADLTLEEGVTFAAGAGFNKVKAERRYAGVTNRNHAGGRGAPTN